MRREFGKCFAREKLKESSPEAGPGPGRRDPRGEREQACLLEEGVPEVAGQVQQSARAGERGKSRPSQAVEAVGRVREAGQRRVGEVR